MSGLIAAELLKMRTARSTWSLLLVLPVVAVVSLMDATFDPAAHNRTVVAFIDVALVISALAAAALAAGQVGTEFTRGSVGLDYLASPRRSPVLIAKLIAFAVFGATCGLLAAVVAHLVAPRLH